MKKFLLFFVLCVLMCFWAERPALAADDLPDFSLSDSEKRSISNAVLEKLPKEAQEYVKANRTSILENLKANSDPAGIDSIQKAFNDGKVPKEIKAWVGYYKAEVKHQIEMKEELKAYEWKMNDANPGYDDGLPLINKDLLPYLIGDDLKYVLDYKTEVLDKGTSGWAAYYYWDNDIKYASGGLEQTLAMKQVIAHHEVVHLKDFKALNDAGITPAMIVYLDGPSYIMLHTILEARACAEEMVFAYQRGKVFKGEYQEAYEKNANSWDFYKVFDKAIKAGKSIEEARHLTEIAVINSNDFYYSSKYIQDYINYSKKYKDYELFSLTLDQILEILCRNDENGPWLTKDDVYSGITTETGTFWEKFCRSDDYEQDSRKLKPEKGGFEMMKDSTFCKEAEKRFNEACDKFEKKWGGCRRAIAIKSCSNICANEAFGRDATYERHHILMPEKDQTEALFCCRGIYESYNQDVILEGAKRMPWIF